MKTSIILLVLIIVNTSALFSEPLARFVHGIDLWLFITLEIALILSFYINYEFKGLNEIAHVDFSTELFYVKPKNKTQGKP